jgi:hypothetical protein
LPMLEEPEAYAQAVEKFVSSSAEHLQAQGKP